MIDQLLTLIEDFGRDKTLPGVYLAQPTGKIHPEDATYIEVLIHEQSFYAKPCMAFGMFNVPDAAWLEKNADDIMVWVAFEHGNPSHPVYLGISPIDESITFTDTLSRQKTWKGVNFNVLIDDAAGSFVVNQVNDDGDPQRTVRIDGDGISLSDAQGSSFVLDSSGNMEAKNKAGYSVKLGDSGISTGKTAAQTAVLAEGLDSLMSKLLTALSQATVVVNGAPVPLTNAASFAAMVSDIKNIYAKSVKLD